MVNDYVSEENHDAPAIEGSDLFLVRLKAGDRDAFEDMIRRWYPPVYRTALYYCRDPEDARDVTQEAFFAACLKIQSFHGRSSLGSWLNRIARNTALMRLRERRRRHRLEYAVTQAQLSLPSGWTSHLQRVGSVAELRLAIESAINALPPDYSAVCILRLCCALSTSAVAHALNISEDTVKSRLHQARALLKRALKDHFRDQLDDSALFYGPQWWKSAA